MSHSTAKLKAATMRTIYLGGDYFDGIAGAKRTSRLDHRVVALELEPEGDDMPVFDRAASGYRGEYERPTRDDAYEGTWVSNPNRRR